MGKEFACNAGDRGDAGSIPGLGRSLGEGDDNSPQYSCLGNPMDRGAWWATAYGVTESDIASEQQHQNHTGGLGAATYKRLWNQTTVIGEQSVVDCPAVFPAVREEWRED